MRLRKGLDTLSWDERRTVIRTIVARIEIADDDVTIVYRVPATTSTAVPGSHAQAEARPALAAWTADADLVATAAGALANATTLEQACRIEPQVADASGDDRTARTLRAIGRDPRCPRGDVGGSTLTFGAEPAAACGRPVGPDGLRERGFATCTYGSADAVHSPSAPAHRPGPRDGSCLKRDV